MDLENIFNCFLIKGIYVTSQLYDNVHHTYCIIDSVFSLLSINNFFINLNLILEFLILKHEI
jgi:hypothetical protein